LYVYKRCESSFKRPIKNGKFRVTGSIEYTIRRKTKQKYNTICVGHHYIRVITKLPNSEQSFKGKVKTHKYLNRQNPPDPSYMEDILY
jgi:hypothetical protein